MDVTGTAGVGQARGPASAVSSPKVTTADARGKHLKKTQTKPKPANWAGRQCGAFLGHLPQHLTEMWEHLRLGTEVRPLYFTVLVNVSFMSLSEPLGF